jgi:predicted DNA-binding transcriptional regulator AlpA
MPAEIIPLPTAPEALAHAVPTLSSEPALLLTARQGASLCGVSTATWWRWDSAGRIPAALRLSPGCVRWRRAELVDWTAAGCPERRTWEAIQTARNGRK